jgi:hypothetical protein
MLESPGSYHSGDVSDEARKGKFKQSQIEPAKSEPVPQESNGRSPKEFQASASILSQTAPGSTWSYCPFGTRTQELRRRIRPVISYLSFTISLEARVCGARVTLFLITGTGGSTIALA